MITISRKHIVLKYIYRKDLAINYRIDKMRPSAKRSLFKKEDVIIEKSVCCIYGLRMPEHFEQAKLTLEVGNSYILSRFPGQVNGWQRGQILPDQTLRPPQSPL
jgi:excinuclease UvrABC helicase subunit UvrB